MVIPRISKLMDGSPGVWLPYQPEPGEVIEVPDSSGRYRKANTVRVRVGACVWNGLDRNRQPISISRVEEFLDEAENEKADP